MSYMGHLNMTSVHDICTSCCVDHVTYHLLTTADLQNYFPEGGFITIYHEWWSVFGWSSCVPLRA